MTIRGEALRGRAKTPARTGAVLLTALLCATAGCGGGGGGGTPSASPSASQHPSRAVKDGHLTFTVLTLRCGLTAVTGSHADAPADGQFDGPMPLHFGEQLSQAQIAALYVLAALVSSGAAALAGRKPPRLMLALATVLITLSIALGGATEMVGVWVGVAINTHLMSLSARSCL